MSSIYKNIKQEYVVLSVIMIVFLILTLAEHRFSPKSKSVTVKPSTQQKSILDHHNANVGEPGNSVVLGAH